MEQVIHRLSDARLVLIEGGGEREGATVELCHESLIESWDKLKQWLSESEQDAQFVARLHAAAQQWEASQEAEGGSCGAMTVRPLSLKPSKSDARSHGV